MPPTRHASPKSLGISAKAKSHAGADEQAITDFFNIHARRDHCSVLLRSRHGPRQNTHTRTPLTSAEKLRSTFIDKENAASTKREGNLRQGSSSRLLQTCNRTFAAEPQPSRQTRRSISARSSFDKVQNTIPQQKSSAYHSAIRCFRTKNAATRRFSACASASTPDRSAASSPLTYDLLRSPRALTASR